jgi:hypothetical protein
MEAGLLSLVNINRRPKTIGVPTTFEKDCSSSNIFTSNKHH